MIGAGVEEVGAHDAGPHDVVCLEHTSVGDGGAGRERRLYTCEIYAVAAHLVRVRATVKIRVRVRVRVRIRVRVRVRVRVGVGVRVAVGVGFGLGFKLGFR